MINRNIFKEIPAQKYHSAIFTSYSINMYYWDIQVVKALNNKGILNIGILADADCLSEQLLKFSSLLGSHRGRNYSIHGFKTKGAFHPKIMFFAGKKEILALIGSGNVTTAGHGKNLEVWTPISVSSKTDSMFLMILDIWNYLNDLYSDLGYEAGNFISSIKQNCDLLLDAEQGYTDNKYNIDNDNTIRFFGKTAQQNIFGQIKKWIGDDEIKNIRVLSPFYDNNASMLNTLNSTFHPDRIDAIIENGLGNIPHMKSLPNSIHFFDWSKCIKNEEIKQNLFHAKCFSLEGKQYNYLICGSSNASYAAISGSNYEANVGYKSKSNDYWANSGIIIDYNKELDKTKLEGSDVEHEEKTSEFIWIKEASYEYQDIEILLQSELSVERATVIVQPTNKSDLFRKMCKIEKNKPQTIKFTIDKEFVPFRIWIEDRKGTIISNCQYAINSIGMSQNDPSSENANFRKYCLKIEQGNFLNGAVINFISKVLNGKNLGKQLKPIKKVSDDNKTSDDNGYIFSSYEEFKKDNEIIPISVSKELRHQQRASMLMDSIIRYIKQSSSNQDDEKMENVDFTEDTGKSRGSKNKAKTVVKESKLRDMANNLFSTLKDYLLHLESVTIDDVPKKASVLTKEELTSFMMVCEVINRLFGYIEWLPDENQSVIDEYFTIPYGQRTRFTLTEYLYRITSLWSLHVIQNNGIVETNKYIEPKVIQFKQEALELLLSILSVCDLNNSGNEFYDIFSNIYKPIVFKNIFTALDIQYINYDTLEDDVYRNIDSDLKRLPDFNEGEIRRLIQNNIYAFRSQEIISTTKAHEGQYVFNHSLGCVYIGQFIGQTQRFVPLTTAGRYNQVKNAYRLEYAYDLEEDEFVKLTSAIKTTDS